MKQILGILLILAGIALGLYVGVWLMFIGGIVAVITAVKAATTVPLDVAIGIARIVFAGFVGMLSAYLLIIPGVALFSSRRHY